MTIVDVDEISLPAPAPAYAPAMVSQDVKLKCPECWEPFYYLERLRDTDPGTYLCVRCGSRWVGVREPANPEVLRPLLRELTDAVRMGRLDIVSPRSSSSAAERETDDS